MPLYPLEKVFRFRCSLKYGQNGQPANKILLTMNRAPFLNAAPLNAEFKPAFDTLSKA
jgi:hypothetical protein